MITMRAQAVIACFLCLGCASARPAGGPSNRDTCVTTCVDIFGGAMPIPTGYKLQPEFGDQLRLVRIDRDPTKPYGNIYIGRVETLPPKEQREESASELGASFERKSRGALTIEVTTRTTRQLLVDKPVRYVSALIYDNRHYMRITDSDPEMWKEMIDGCARCGK